MWLYLSDPKIENVHTNEIQIHLPMHVLFRHFLKFCCITSVFIDTLHLVKVFLRCKSSVQFKHEGIIKSSKYSLLVRVQINHPSIAKCKMSPLTANWQTIGHALAQTLTLFTLACQVSAVAHRPEVWDLNPSTGYRLGNL